MPSSQIQSCGQPNQTNNCTIKPPLPNKPPPPPPPPPRNSSQLLCQTSIPPNQLCGGLLGPSSNGSNILNNGSSMNSLNSAGRCNHAQPMTAPVCGPNHGQRGFNPKHVDNFSSRSSVSSHGSSLHHHHHHHSNNNLHTVQLSSSSSMSSLQPVDPSSFVHRCSISQQNNLVTQTSANAKDSLLRPSSNVNHCNHLHRTNTHVCNHHHPANYCHHMQSVIEQQAPHECVHVNCLQAHNDGGNCNNGSNMSMIGKTCASNSLHHQHHGLDQEHFITANRSSDISNNESLLSTNHAHNLSNSSTTTHTSNVAVKHQPQFHRPVLSQGGRSNSSQQYEQYCLSSAASTSSATASLSSYQTPAGFDDLVPLYPSSKIHQPLPPPPPPHLKSRAPSPSTQHLLFNTVSTAQNNNIHAGAIISNNTNNNGLSYNNSSNVSISNGSTIMKTQFFDTPQPNQQLSAFNQPTLPPKRHPPKPISPTSTCSTQITTVRTSPSLQNQPITRVTSQAGVQNPLPSSDVPPPLPPLNLSSRPLPLVNSHMTRIQHIGVEDVLIPNQTANILNSNFSQRQQAINTIQTDADRKPVLPNTRHIELTAEQQLHQKSGETVRICPKCCDKVTIGQDACKAMNQIYHAACMVCCVCNRTLVGETFYPVDDKVYCVDDFKFTGHMQPLEKCAACNKPISTMILPAMGKSYHPECFKCCICGQCLDGVPFTIDMKNKIYCVKDYHNIYSPKCAACGKSISPMEGTGETVRVVSMNKDYHIDCYCCEDCGLQLTDEEPSRSYPLDDHLLCHQCHINRLSKQMQPALNLS